LSEQPLREEINMRSRRSGWVLGVLALFAPLVGAQDAVPKLIRIIVPFSPGGSNDVIARMIAPPLAKRLEASVVVDNRPGASGMLGADLVAKSARDGATLLLTSSTLLTAAATQPRVPYDPVAAFAPVAMVGQSPSLLAVSAWLRYKTPAELLAAVRSRPDEFTYGTAGVGSVAHLATELLSASAKLHMRHVPYKGALNAAIDLASGQIQIMISSYGSLVSFLKSGKIRAIAVTSKQPSASFPDLPTLNTFVPGFFNEVWVGVFAPAGAPTRLIERLNREINEISAAPEMKSFQDADGMVPAALTPQVFAASVKEEFLQWKRTAATRKIVVE
jgi:tripartite-type tricarboxylate transporter receptor subunit TctC